VAVINSISFSSSARRLLTKESSGAARMIRAILRRFSCVLRSASRRADDAPTPNIMPADVGAVRREIRSGMRSLSADTHCFRRGSHPTSTSSSDVEKNLESLKPSVKSLLHDLWAAGSLLKP